MAATIKIWLHAFRLRTLPLALSSTFLGSFIAFSHDKFSWEVAVFAVLTTLFLQILSNLANDYGDARKGTDNEERIGPQRVTQSGMVTMKAIKRMIAVFVSLSLISGLALIYFGLKQLPFYIAVVFFVVGISAIYAAIKYTMGKNPYGYVGLGDVFVFIYFGLVGVCGTYFLHAGTVDPWIILPASTIGLLSSGVLNLNNLRDIENDSKCGKKTLVVRIGSKSAKFYHLLLVLVSVIFSVAYTIISYKSPWQFLYLLTLPFLVSNVKTVLQNKVPVELDPELKKLALITCAFAIAFGLGLVF
ncbi:1,4-dihydroxy-2-naphthoate polyprenyltransferase [Prolixibacteraceae bacterium Z1-6]|uniref:1,4-dihydroxy-2-naphthoate octaprenyltransferase n=1 Tax=Draconibacterium aestuarii TaxID=2998507 RepID=A0A9X3J5X6_9BACT|nr:1,4-dihydroxy-2-naphthoate polyprenyltransferase [Prolixibacteraceae bacterium Z1-6]